MNLVRRTFLTLAVTLPGAIASAQGPELFPVVFQAESGAVGGEFSVATDAAAGVQYAAINTTEGGGNPLRAGRVITYSVNFPASGVYELYARVRVGPATFNDDSMYYGNGFGTKVLTNDNDWVRVNGLANNFGYTLPTDRVLGGGIAGSNVWKWVKLAAFPFDEPPVNFSVSAGTTYTFQVGGREDGLWLDKFAFGQQGVFFTVANLDNGTAGTTEPPPPPFVPTGPPMALDQPKFLGGVSSPTQDANMTAYFNQVTPENAGKWGSVEGTRNAMQWGQLDTAYFLAKNNLLKAPGDPRDGTPYPLPFRLHTLTWGNQQPAWIESLPPEQQLAEIHEWFAALAARYPAIDFIDVVNEPLHDPPAGAGNGNYIAALGGSGATGWDWVITAFEMARFYFPSAKLGINEFSVTNDTSAANQYIGIVELLKQRGLIDYVGIQGHAFSTRVSAATTLANLNLLATTDVPLHVTELDIDGPTDDVQLADYQRIFPVFWEHPAVRGITTWGYRPGHWRTAQGAYLVLDNGAERPAMAWLQDYVRNATLPPWIEQHPAAAQSATVGDTVSFTCAGNGSAPLGYSWRRDGGVVPGSEATLVIAGVRTADAGVYECVVSNAAGSATSRGGSLSVAKAAASVTLSDLLQTYDGQPRAVTVETSPAALGVLVLYDGSATAPTNAGTYAVSAEVADADYFGSAAATLVVQKATAAVSFADLSLSYDGNPRPVTVVTVPPGLNAVVTYDGASAPPVAPGSYAVEATVADANYVGSATGVLRIGASVVVRHAPSVNGRVDGSVHVLLPESTTLNGGAVVSGDLLLPGSPTVRLNGSPSYQGTLNGNGSASPSSHTVTLNGGAALRHVVRRTNAVPLPAVPAPPGPAGTRNVVLNGPGQSAGDFATLRNLTLNGNAGAVAVPPGTYGSFVVNGNGSLVLGVAGASEPAVYNLQGLVLNGAASLSVVGPVVVNLATATTVNSGAAGNAAHPDWLSFNVAAGGVTLNGGAVVHGSVTAPSGTVMVNGTLNGSVAADRLTVNGGGRIRAAP